MKIYVGIATAGRREILAETLSFLANQTRLPDKIILAPAEASDVPREVLATTGVPFAVVDAPQGLCSQRNAIIEASADADVLLFIDDDFFAAPTYLSACAVLFASNSHIAVATGRVVADGALGPGIEPDEARQILQDTPAGERMLTPAYGGYGCNMAVRVRLVVEQGLRFDTALPLYGWQEDIDFSRRLARFGSVVRSFEMYGVHLGAKRGRTSGVRLGYSQVANPIYLMSKGTVSARYACPLMFRNLAKNLGRSLIPEPYIDRRGRLRGNLLALLDFLFGRLRPQKILEL